MQSVEQYGLFELEVPPVQAQGAVEGAVTFTHDKAQYCVPAFRSGEGRWCARFMPVETGVWRYRCELGGQTIEGEFSCMEHTASNHGPVAPEEHHFRYADGGRYLPFGTTCYAWTHQSPDLQEQTLQTLEKAPFNKLRMCVFPKHMPYNENEPAVFPFEKSPDGTWDVQRPCEAYWQNLDEHVAQLAALGIEVDLILFHPYDRWGFANMGREKDLAYLSYCVARLAAHHNIWWSLANEYDLVVDKDYADWDAFGELVARQDPYHHPISIHNCLPIYPRRDWMTHCSVQTGDINSVLLLQQEYGLPVLIDECGYEGDIEYNWGNLSAREMVHRFWWAMGRGGYCTHGETFHREDEVLWWAKGGRIYGESAQRIRFLREVFDSIAEPVSAKKDFQGMDPNGNVGEDKGDMPNGFDRAMGRLPEWERTRTILSLIPVQLASENHLLLYFGKSCPAFSRFSLPGTGRYQVEVLDTWEMKRELSCTDVCGDIKIELPAKEGMAVLISRLCGPALQ